MLVTIIDDAHLMDMENLRKLRLLFEDFPKNHNLILIGQPELLTNLNLSVNQDLKSRVTYSVITKRLHPDSMREFIHRELERMGLAHSTFTEGATELIIRSADGVLRRCRNLCLATMLEAVRASGGQHDGHRSGQPRPDSAALAEGNRHHGLLIGSDVCLPTASCDRRSRLMISDELLRAIRNDLPMKSHDTWARPTGSTLEAIRGLLPLPLSGLRRTASDREPPKEPGALLLLRTQLQQHRPADEPRLRLPLGRRTARSTGCENTASVALKTKP